MKNQKSKLNPILVALGWSVAVLLALPLYTVLAHHGESLQVSPSQASQGDSVTITGSGFPSGSIVRISLEGVLGEVTVADVTVTAAGELQTSVVVPHDADAGPWFMVASAGGEKAFADFIVREGTMGKMDMPEAETASDASSEHAGMVMPATTGTGAQNGATTIVIERSDTETIVIGIIIAMLVLTGGVLVLVGTRTRTAA